LQDRSKTDRKYGQTGVREIGKIGRHESRVSNRIEHGSKNDKQKGQIRS